MAIKTPDQYDAISGDTYEVETCMTDEGKKYFVRSLIPHGDVTQVGWESGLHLNEKDAWQDLHTELCRRSHKPASTRWFLRAHNQILTAR